MSTASKVRVPEGVSPPLRNAIEALARELERTDNPVGAARAVRRVAARHPLDYDTSREAYRRWAEKRLMPFFGNDLHVAKAVVWLACDAGWEAIDAR